jgi:L-rhamnose mutarotase
MDKCPSYKQAKEVFDEMVKQGIKHNSHTYSILLKKLKREQYGEATSIIQRMRHEELLPNDKHFNQLVKLSPDETTARNWIDEMELAGYHADKFTYSSLLGKIRGAPKVFLLKAEMKNKGIKIDAKMYQNMMAKTQEFDAATILYQELMSRRWYIDPGLQQVIRDTLVSLSKGNKEHEEWVSQNLL